METTFTAARPAARHSSHGQSGTLAPPMFPHSPAPAPQSHGASHGAMLPFGLTRALPVVPGLPHRDWPGELSYCPRRQLTITQDGTPFIDTPSMATEIKSVTQTQEDSQIWDDDGGTDTD
jgi:putative ATP-grasp target RiPP